MKQFGVYRYFLIFLAFALLLSTACARKSGCGVLDEPTKVSKRKTKQPYKRDLLGRKN